MDNAEITEILRRRVADIFDLDPEEIQPSSRLVADLDADSIDLLELILGLKDEFGISVSDGEVKLLLTELARFLPADYGSNGELTDAELAEVSRALTVATITDFIADRMGAPA